MKVIKKIIKAIKLKQQYKQELLLSKDLPISFHNWWTNDREALEKDWFLIFMQCRLGPFNTKKINLISTMGRRKIVDLLKKERMPIIFCTGENVYSKEAFNYTAYEDHLLDDVDLALGFASIEHKKYLRFPIWLMRLSPDVDSLNITMELQKLQNKRLHPKNNFCSLVARHDNNGIRLKLFELLNPIDQIDCAGDFLNNTSKLREKYNNNKIAFLENYMFNICPENSNTQGYVTEKVFDAIEAGCLPIYWGSESNPEPDVLNKEAILFYDQNNPDALFNQVKELYQNQKLYSDFMSQAVFLPTAQEYIADTLNQLEARLSILIKNS